jgi:hypothetical protein
MYMAWRNAKVPVLSNNAFQWLYAKKKKKNPLSLLESVSLYPAVLLSKRLGGGTPSTAGVYMRPAFALRKSRQS